MKQILFIDDDELRLSSHIEFLELTGYDVTLASDVKSALSLVEQRKNNLSAIILDMIMPFGEGPFDDETTSHGYRTGIALLKEIKKRAPNVPLIMCTVVDDPQAKSDAIRFGAVRYITKPVLASELIEVIEQVSQDKD